MRFSARVICFTPIAAHDFLTGFSPAIDLMVLEPDSLQVEPTGLEPTVSKTLSFQIAPEMLQGVAMSECLKWWGKHWADSNHQHTVTRRIQQVHKYDNFISHDWGTSRWLKLAALLVVFNSQAAAAASLLVSLLVGVLRISSVLPNHIWTAFAGHIAFVAVLCFWQRLRELVRRPRIVFLDKLCISQEDEALKEQGILSLPGFLDQSEELTILWSGKYLTRLWCTYELISFLQNPQKRKSVHVIPVKLCLLICLMSVAWHCMAAGYYIAYREIDAGARTSIDARFLFQSVAVLILPLQNYVSLGLLAEIQELPQQVRSFSIRAAKLAVYRCLLLSKFKG